MSSASVTSDSTLTDGPLDTGPPVAHPAISERTVRALVDTQLPHLADHPVGDRFDGWDMAMFRLGGALAVRLPRSEPAVASLGREIRWTPALSPTWSFAYPRIVEQGVPGAGYPWPWAVVTWVPGTTADTVPLTSAAGTPAGRAIAQIHGRADARVGSASGPTRPGVEQAWFNPEQSITMAQRTAEVMWALERVEDRGGPAGVRLDTGAARAIWDAALAAPEPAEQVWSHADMHGSNVLSDHGAFAGLIDWGKVARCDRAVDLGFLYTSMPRAGVDSAVAAYREDTGVDDPGLDARVLGIALHKCLLWATLDRPLNLEMAWRGLAELGCVRRA